MFFNVNYFNYLSVDIIFLLSFSSSNSRWINSILLLYYSYKFYMAFFIFSSSYLRTKWLISNLLLANSN